MLNVVLTGGTGIDESVFTTVTTAAKSVLGLFTEFPINVFLAVSIMGIAVGLVRKLKRG